MTTPINDDTLLLYYYNEGLRAEERDAIAAAIRRDPLVRDRYEELRTFLRDLRDTPRVAVSDNQRARWNRAIASAAGTETSRRGTERLHAPSFVWGLAAALVIALGVALSLGLRTPTSAPDGTPDVTQSPASGYLRRAAFDRGVREHFRRSRANVVDMEAMPGDARQALALDIVRQNRLFERSAEHHNADDLARLLRAFEPVLLELAAPQTSAVRAESLKNQLRFELGVVLTKMAPPISTDTETI